MNRRQHGSKPTLALWMLVAVADVAIIVAATGLLTFLLVLTVLAVIVGGVLIARSMLSGAMGTTQGLNRHDPEPAEAVARRRA